MEINNTSKYILAIGLQLVIIFTIIIFKLFVLAGGTTVALQILPVDPRDPLRGDYMVFRYGISEVPENYFVNKPKNGEIVYIPLKKSGQYYTFTYGASNKKPQENRLFIKGVVTSGGFSVTNATRLGRGNIHVSYGIEEYFIPEGKGQGFFPRGENNFVTVSVDSSGNAVLKQLYIEGNPWP